MKGAVAGASSVDQANQRQLSVLHNGSRGRIIMGGFSEYPNDEAGQGGKELENGRN
jgi:hypothetical protein